MNNIFAQLHRTPNCGNNFSLVWSTFPTLSNEYGWSPGTLSNTLNNVDASGIDMSIKFTGETSTLGFWAGQTPKIGSQSSYMYKGIDLLTNGFSKDGITCKITFSKPIYAMSFDIHHINFYRENGDKYIITGKNENGETIYPEFNTSAHPSYTVDNSTGTVNAIANLTSGENPIVGVNFADSKLIKSITIHWQDCESCSKEKPHATGIGNFSFCTPQALGFDGKDDFISSPSFLGGKSEITIMSWIKPKTGSIGGNIIGQANCSLFIDENKRLKAFIKTDSGVEIETPDLDTAIINDATWKHVALIYNGINGKISLFINGEEIWQYDADISNTFLNNSEDWNTNYNFEIGRHPMLKSNYFSGSINECKVFNKALTTSQLKKQIHQKIKNNNESITGEIIPTEIEGLQWNNLLLYYQMVPLNSGFTTDLSNYSINGKLNNMDVSQEYTAPLPYISKASSNGNWLNIDNWMYGKSLNINNIPDHAIVEINGNLNIDDNKTLLGLIINKGAKISVNNNSGLFNTGYLKLDGTLLLNENSQLIQLDESTLDVTSSGILEKDIFGTADTYTYDYWSSPVGTQNTTSNNKSYTVEDIFNKVTFLETGYDGISIPLSIADYWIWKFGNKLSDSYASWQQVRSENKILVGEGFTMKGPGSGEITDKQKYTLKGKPNNGIITLNVSQDNDYLIGNPYPSAIDAVKFLLDNKETSTGTLYFWKHWGGGSHHNASEYQGGYATFSLAGGVPAATTDAVNNQTEVLSINNTVPNRYIPVGQGFYLTAISNGTIEFNNTQRLFNLSDLTNNESSQNTEDNQANKVETLKQEDNRIKLRIGFNSVNSLTRQLLLTIDNHATAGVDWGYDSKYIDTQIDDMYWVINNEKYLIQAIDNLNEETIIPLGIHTNTDGFNSIALDALENKNSNINIYVFDNESNRYHDLVESKFKIYLEKGIHLNRFELRFSKSSETLSSENFENDSDISIYFSNSKSSMIIENENSNNIKGLEMFNILGQSLFKLKLNTNKKYLEYRIPNNATGNYIIKIDTEFNSISKKISIN